MKPCKECPFKKNSAPGYLGECSYDPEMFLQQGEDLPCHMTVDYETEEEPDYSKAKLCAGNLQFMNNRLKLSRIPSIREEQKIHGKNDQVFSTVLEFIHYHTLIEIKPKK